MVGLLGMLKGVSLRVCVCFCVWGGGGGGGDKAGLVSSTDLQQPYRQANGSLSFGLIP